VSSGEDQAVEHHLEVVRTARYWTLGPPEADDVWVVLHGYNQLARRFLRRFVPIDDGARYVVAPEALSRFYVAAEQGRHGAESVVGGTWMTREDRHNEIRDYVAYLDRLHDALDVGGRRLTVLGFSQGVATATRWVVQGAARPERLVLWGDFTPPDLDLERARAALADVDLVMVRGSDDRALGSRLAEEERTRLAGAGIAYRSLVYEGGHDIDAETLRGLAEL
jgi:predicted esterase